MMVTKKDRLATVILLAALLGCTNSSYRKTTEGDSGSANNPGISFAIGKKAVQLLPYPMRISKLRYVVGNDDANLYREIESRRNELGGFDYANGIRQELSWLESRMAVWTKGLQPICSSEHMRNKYAWTGGLRNLIIAALGREPTPQDNEVIARIDGTGVSNADKFEVYCLIVLSSLEFLTL